MGTMNAGLKAYLAKKKKGVKGTKKTKKTSLLNVGLKPFGKKGK